VTSPPGAGQVPAECATFYARYTAALEASGVAARTVESRARAIRRFLRWLPGNAGDITAVLTQPHAWAQATARFTATLATPSGAPATSAQWHADALADAARRLHLTATYETVPARYQHIHHAYQAALGTLSLSAATAESYLNAVDAFLRWAGRTGRTGDLRRRWATTTAMYLEHLAATGRAPATIRRRRVILRHCAAQLHMAAPAGISGTRGATRPRRGELALARYDWAARSYYLLTSPAGTRVITTTAALPLHTDPAEDARDAAARLAQHVAAQIFAAPIEQRLAWASVAGTQMILLADGEHAHLAERGPAGTTTRRCTAGQALRAWLDRVAQQVTRHSELLAQPSA
jgi:hypothetical protein